MLDKTRRAAIGAAALAALSLGHATHALITSDFAGSHTVAVITSYYIDMATDGGGLWTLPPGWLVDPQGPQSPDYHPFFVRTWGEFGVDMYVTDQQYGPIIEGWAAEYFGS